MNKSVPRRSRNQLCLDCGEPSNPTCQSPFFKPFGGCVPSPPSLVFSQWRGPGTAGYRFEPTERFCGSLLGSITWADFPVPWTITVDRSITTLLHVCLECIPGRRSPFPRSFKSFANVSHQSARLPCDLSCAGLRCIWLSSRWPERSCRIMFFLRIPLLPFSAVDSLLFG